MAQKSLSDSFAKNMCVLYLKSLCYEQISIAGRDDGYDILAYKDSKENFFEVKYSSKKKGKFFGTVMLTELYKAVNNEENFYFIVCRGNEGDNNLNNWFFKIFSVTEFIEHCTLTTPIFHYHLYLNQFGETTKKVNFKETTIKATKELVLRMWNDFKLWKTR